MRNIREWKDFEGNQCLGIEVNLEDNSATDGTKTLKIRKLINRRMWQASYMGMIQYEKGVEVFDVVMDRLEHVDAGDVFSSEMYVNSFCTHVDLMMKSLWPYQEGMRDILVVEFASVGEQMRPLTKMEKEQLFGRGGSKEVEGNCLYYMERMELCDAIQNALRKSVVRNSCNKVISPQNV